VTPHRHSTRRWLSIGAAAGAALLLATTVAPADADPNNNTSRKLRAAVTPEGIAEHLTAFDRIADENGESRASGLPGYAASRDYVVDRLEAAGYAPSVQEFDFPFFRELTPATMEQVSPEPKIYDNPDDFTSMTYSFSGDVTGTVVAVDTDGTPTETSTSGCEAADFTGFPAGAIALMQRGTCAFGDKAKNAQDAGAVAAIVFNRGTAGATEAVAGTLGSPLVTIPVVGASHSVGLDLMDPADTVVHIQSSTESEIRPTWNVLAETARGDDANVVMAGAHLDSVVAGPGVNDNGSGSASLLEVAEQMSKVKPKNTVRFAWWGAEELGLLGSTHYVGDLAENDPAALQDIALYLNFDMVGSPNYVRFVYDGDNSKFPVGPAAAEGPAGSGEIEGLFHDYFASQQLPSEETPFSGRSDYGPFIEEGIPAGGLFTGAEGVKTEEQAAVFGGEAGVAYDHCYHQACDDLSNVNMNAIDEMSDAIAHAILTYAMDTRSVNGKGKGHPVSPPGQRTAGVPVGSGTPDGGGLHDEHGHERDAR
jgi:Zn-dependent M28 family amino/carboxypeptidase